MEDIAEDEDLEEDLYEGFLISDESDINNPDSNKEAEPIISTPKVEIENDDKSIISISEEEEAEIFPEGVKSMQDTSDVIDLFPEKKDSEVLRSAESRPKRENTGAGID